MEIQEGYVKVSPVFLQAEEPLQVSIYIYMPKNKKVVLFQKKGDTLPTEKLLEIMKLPPSQILTTPDEEKIAMSSVTGNLAEQLENSETITPQVSAAATRVVSSLTQVNSTDSVERLNETKTILEDSSELVNKVVTQFKESGSKKGFKEILASFQTKGDSLETHQKHVAALSVLLLLSFGEGSAQDVTELAYAAMAHDMGLKSLPPAEMLRHVQGEEIHAILSHPEAENFDGTTPKTKHIEASLKFLRDTGKELTDGVCKIISQHHENFDGSGPLGISGRRIYGPAKILRVTDDIIAALSKATGISDVETAFQKLKAANMYTGKARFYDEELIAQLERVMRS